MKPDVYCGGEKIEIEMGREDSIDCVRLPDGRYSLLVQGRVYDLVAELEGESCLVEGRQGRAVMNVRDPRSLSPERVTAGGQEGLQRLNAEMPGKVIRVLVQVGDAVVYEQGLMVIEAMKMQNEIRATKAGTIKSIGVTAGNTVNTGDFLLSIE
jgi:biotin carboxyl carrier protein